MPYIPMEDRKRWEESLMTLDKEIVCYGISNGDLNFLFTCLANMYLIRHGKSYNVISDVIKAMECAKLEFYRRIAAPYEDEKCNINGDVY